ncbi:hypothetical protein C8R47DRAFT_1149082 [Mycena vitilis]|nr:hypothetical protein C8R47DRAFT_1149082 [Mycena vitilis]
MALARLSSIPIELQYLASAELGPSDLLALSHVSTYWRAFVLSDKRWSEWFSLIRTSDETLQECLARFNILDTVSKRDPICQGIDELLPHHTITDTASRKLVYLCLHEWCAACGDYACDLFLPHMKRVCGACLKKDEFAVINFSAALAKYDLRERQVNSYSLLTLEWCDPNRNSKRSVKLVSESQMKEIAIRHWGSEDTLQRHLEQTKTAARSTYSARSDEYRSAVSTRDALADKGNLAAAESVVLPRTGRKIPKAFPVYPPILLPARTVDRKVVCFAPQTLVEVGGELVCDAADSDSDSDGSASEA